jgi:ATP-dependent Clp protease protease subunit
MLTRFEEETEEKENEAPGSRAEQLFFKSRTVIIAGGIDDKQARRAVTHLLALAEESDDPINVLISSPGGHVESGDMVHDVIKFIRPTVRTIGSGWVASAGALIFVGAARENRFCLPNTRFLLHQPSGGIRGQVSDLMIQAEQIRIMTERFNHLFAAATGQTPEKIAEDTQRDFWLKPQQAVEYGLCGKIISSVDELG